MMTPTWLLRGAPAGPGTLDERDRDPGHGHRGRTPPSRSPPSRTLPGTSPPRRAPTHRGRLRRAALDASRRGPRPRRLRIPLRRPPVEVPGTRPQPRAHRHRGHPPASRRRRRRPSPGSSPTPRTAPPPPGAPRAPSSTAAPPASTRPLRPGPRRPRRAAHVTLSTRAVRTGVIELDGDRARLLVFLDQTSTRTRARPPRRRPNSPVTARLGRRLADRRPSRPRRPCAEMERIHPPETRPVPAWPSPSPSWRRGFRRPGLSR